MRVETFHHLRTGKTTGGATVRVVGDTEIVGQVEVQVAFCHGGGGTKDGKKFKGDPYCKKIGRDNAAKTIPKIIPLRFLPSFLSEMQSKANALSKREWREVPDFSFSIRRFLPKE
jgi:hypothetical protein